MSVRLNTKLKFPISAITEGRISKELNVRLLTKAGLLTISITTVSFSGSEIAGKLNKVFSPKTAGIVKE